MQKFKKIENKKQGAALPPSPKGLGGSAVNKMKKLVFLSVFIAFASPFAISAEEFFRNIASFIISSLNRHRMNTNFIYHHYQDSYSDDYLPLIRKKRLRQHMSEPFLSL